MEIDRTLLSWADLPLDPTLLIFSYLDKEQLIKSSYVNKYWNDVSLKDELWKKYCINDWLIDSRGKSESFKQTYVTMYKDFGRYINHYKKVKTLWMKIESWLEKHNPQILATLAPGATEQELADFEQATGYLLDGEMRCSFRIHNGQIQQTSNFEGLFGGYKFYDYHVNLQLGNLTKMQTFKERVGRSLSKAPEWIKESLPVVQSYQGWKNYFYVFKKDHKLFGQIVEPTQNLIGVFSVANSYIQMLHDLFINLETGCFEISKKRKEIIRYPTIGSSTETTKGVKVTCSPLFVPERSVVLPSPQYFFAYRIRIEMSENHNKEDSCKLANRHWVITDGNFATENVSGPGVIGKYPEMYPGAIFEYASCCPLSTSTGQMGGIFEFIRKSDGEKVDVVVPIYKFVAPKLLELET